MRYIVHFISTYKKLLKVQCVNLYLNKQQIYGKNIEFIVHDNKKSYTYYDISSVAHLQINITYLFHLSKTYPILNPSS